MPYNPFHEMEHSHVQQVWDELTDRFGFPEKKWKAKFTEYQSRQQSKGNDEIDLFLRFGYETINPILNSILMRRADIGTFHNLCEYVITKSRSRKKSTPFKKSTSDKP